MVDIRSYYKDIDVEDQNVYVYYYRMVRESLETYRGILIRVMII
jgi:hypothetical protein